MNLLSFYAKLLLYNIPEENILATVISKQKLQTARSTLETIIKFSDNFADITTDQMSTLNVIIHYGFAARLDGLKPPNESHKCVLIYSFVKNYSFVL